MPLPEHKNGLFFVPEYNQDPEFVAPETVKDAAPAGPSFDELDLPDNLLSAVHSLGFTTPTPIQAQAIPALISGRDIVGVAQTGTGKTAAFGLPMLASVDPRQHHVQALVLAPTRELAMQVAEAIESFGAHIGGLDVLAVYGGASFTPQLRALSRGVQVVVGTPGRVIDHIERGTLDLSRAKYLVLDEADEMLRMGFAEDVEKVFSNAPAERQVALFSATMPPAIRRIASQHLTNPLEVTVSRQSSTLTNVKQTFAVVPFRHKIGALARVLATTEADAAIVFTRTRSAAEEVGSELIARGISAATISGDVPQAEREKIIDRLRNNRLDVLVATDVAARGLDVERIGLVVNFDVPGEVEAYVHRIGRTGRAGRTGTALTFLNPREISRLRTIERVTKAKVEEVPIPTPADVSAHKVKALFARVPNRLDRGRMHLYENALKDFMGESELTLENVAVAMAALAIGDEGPSPRDDEDHFEQKIGKPEGRSERFERGDRPERGERFDRGDRPERSDRSERSDRGNTGGRGTRYWIGVGHDHGVRPEAIVGAITGESGLRGKDLGKIDIRGTFSIVEINAEITPEMFGRISAARVAGKQLKIRLDSGEPQSGNGHRGGKHFGGGKFDRPGRSDRGGERGFDRGGERGDRGFNRDRGRGFDRGGFNRDAAAGTRDGGFNRGGFEGRSESRTFENRGGESRSFDAGRKPRHKSAH